MGGTASLAQTVPSSAARACRVAAGDARDDADVRVRVSDDDGETAIERPVGVRGERPLRQGPRRLPRSHAVDAERHRERRPLPEVARLEPHRESRGPDVGLPRDGELGPLLRAWDVDPHAARRVPLPVTRLRLVAHPGSGAEIVEIAGRQRQVDGVRDLAGAVRAQRGAVERLPRLPDGVALTARDA